MQIVFPLYNSPLTLVQNLLNKKKEIKKKTRASKCLQGVETFRHLLASPEEPQTKQHSKKI